MGVEGGIGVFHELMEVIPMQSRDMESVASSWKCEALMAWCVSHSGHLEGDMGSAAMKKVRNQVIKGPECPTEEGIIEEHGLILRFGGVPLPQLLPSHTPPLRNHRSLYPTQEQSASGFSDIIL